MTDQIISFPSKGVKGISPFPSFEVITDAAGIKYVNLGGLYRPGVTNVGLLMQADRTSITPSLTLVDFVQAEQAKFSVPWKVFPAVAANDMSNFDMLFGCVLRLQFAGPGRAIIATL